MTCCVKIIVMPRKIVLLTKNSLYNSKLNDSIKSYVFNKDRFGFGTNYSKERIATFFGNEEEALNDFEYYNPTIEKAYLDINKSAVRRLVISFLDIQDHLQYGLIAYSPAEGRYEFVYANKSLNKIDTSEEDGRTIETEVSNLIVQSIKNLNLKDIEPLEDSCYDDPTQTYTVNHSKIKEKLKSFIHVPFKFENNGTHVIHYSPKLYSLNSYERLKYITEEGVKEFQTV